VGGRRRSRGSDEECEKRMSENVLCRLHIFILQKVVAFKNVLILIRLCLARVGLIMWGRDH
jgi:hypothetical protein